MSAAVGQSALLFFEIIWRPDVENTGLLFTPDHCSVIHDVVAKTPSSLAAGLPILFGLLSARGGR